MLELRFTSLLCSNTLLLRLVFDFFFFRFDFVGVFVCREYVGNWVWLILCFVIVALLVYGFGYWIYGSMQLETLCSIWLWVSLFYLVAEKILDRNWKDTKFSRNCVWFVRKHGEDLSFVVLNFLRKNYLYNRFVILLI